MLRKTKAMFYMYEWGMRLVKWILYAWGRFNTKLSLRNTGLDRQNVVELSRSIWVHAASLGEFEQGKTVIDALKREYPDLPLVLTFFSSSGYEKRKNYKSSDYVYYLPYDTRGDMDCFIAAINPIAVVFIKYEFWFNCLKILNKKGIHYYFISAVFRKGQYFLHRLFRPLLELIGKSRWIFVQNTSSLKLLKEKGILNVSISGDSRVDRVLEIRKEPYDNDLIESFTRNRFTVIVGSSWPPDEKLIARGIREYPEWKWIIAPHEISDSHIRQLRERAGDSAVLLSEAQTRGMDSDANVLIVDKIGILSRIYRYGDIAYIGGGFGAGIHNTLEPVVYGLPVIFGPNFRKFQEARDFVHSGIGVCVSDEEEFLKALKKVSDPEAITKIKNEIEIYLSENSGATERIMKVILKN